MQLGRFRQTIPDVPIVALTATAVSNVQADSGKGLGLRQVGVGWVLRPTLLHVVTLVVRHAVRYFEFSYTRSYTHSFARSLTRSF